MANISFLHFEMWCPLCVSSLTPVCEVFQDKGVRGEDGQGLLELPCLSGRGHELTVFIFPSPTLITWYFVASLGWISILQNLYKSGLLLTIFLCTKASVIESQFLESSSETTWSLLSMKALTELQILKKSLNTVFGSLFIYFFISQPNPRLLVIPAFSQPVSLLKSIMFIAEVFFFLKFICFFFLQLFLII